MLSEPCKYCGIANINCECDWCMDCINYLQNCECEGKVYLPLSPIEQAKRVGRKNAEAVVKAAFLLCVERFSIAPDDIRTICKQLGRDTDLWIEEIKKMIMSETIDIANYGDRDKEEFVNPVTEIVEIWEEIEDNVKMNTVCLQGSTAPSENATLIHSFPSTSWYHTMQTYNEFMEFGDYNPSDMIVFVPYSHRTDINPDAQIIDYGHWNPEHNSLGQLTNKETT